MTAFVSLCLLALAALPVERAAAWGPEGHEAIAVLADDGLSGAARSAVMVLLDLDESLADVASWADDVRGGNHAGPHGGEVDAFNASFPDNPKWHFVNLPLETDRYGDDPSFTGEDDVVHAVTRCIEVLESPDETPHFSRPQALRFLVHLVGDIHQPLHVSSGYYRLTGHHASLITDPAKAKAPGVRHDRGGNQLCLATHCDPNLHGFWDSSMVRKIAHTGTAAKLVPALRAKLADPAWVAKHPALAESPGDYHGWAEQWASDSVRQAREVYAPIELGTATLDGHGLTIAIAVPDDYASRQLDRVTAQLAGGGVHLGQLMNRIQWK